MRPLPSLRRPRQTVLLSALALGACGGATASEAPNDRDATTDAPPGDAVLPFDASAPDAPDAASCATLVADNVISPCIAENCCAPFLACLGAPSCPAYTNCLVTCPNEAGADSGDHPGQGQLLPVVLRRPESRGGEPGPVVRPVRSRGPLRRRDGTLDATLTGKRVRWRRLLTLDPPVLPREDDSSLVLQTENRHLSLKTRPLWFQTRPFSGPKRPS